MKPEILHNDHMMFLDRALETQRTALLTAMAVSYTHLTLPTIYSV